MFSALVFASLYDTSACLGFGVNFYLFFTTGERYDADVACALLSRATYFFFSVTALEIQEGKST
jgi:hypothetical protein